MRRIDLHPKRKLRNPERHLRALKRWQETVHLTFQHGIHPNTDDKYWNIKLPVYAKLCNPPHTTPDLQHACAEALIKAAQNIRALASVNRPYRLASLIQTPSMFWSEVTLFFDRDYLQAFYPPKSYGTSEHVPGRFTTVAPQMEQFEALGLTIPPEFEFVGGYGMIEEGFDEATVHQNHWLIVERLTQI